MVHDRTLVAQYGSAVVSSAGQIYGKRLVARVELATACLFLDSEGRCSGIHEVAELLRA
jgi:hypothetical protein